MMRTNETAETMLVVNGRKVELGHAEDDRGRLAARDDVRSEKDTDHDVCAASHFNTNETQRGMVLIEPRGVLWGHLVKPRRPHQTGPPGLPQGGPQSCKSAC